MGFIARMKKGVEPMPLTQPQPSGTVEQHRPTPLSGRGPMLLLLSRALRLRLVVLGEAVGRYARRSNFRFGRSPAVVFKLRGSSDNRRTFH
jgi:hypothetical protein